MSQTLSYKNVRDLLTGMSYKRGNTGVASRTYTYDAAGRPITRNTARNGTTVIDSFGYNTRSELTAATVNNGTYSYNYDNIGNRNTAQEITEEITNYTANNLNQYTAIGDFAPTYDAAGNQTLVKTTMGIWTVAYDAENRPVSFTNAETNTVIECAYDHMGRRATKKVTVNGSITLHHRYLYRGYLQIACCDLTRSNHPALWLITWDPTQPIATRPLAIQKDGTWYTYGWDLTKNICEVYGINGYIRTNYTYTPYGAVTTSGDVTQPIQWSSEFHDTELALVYYNYRHYNPTDGRWLGRDPIYDLHNKYSYIKNNTISSLDYSGLFALCHPTCNGIIYNPKTHCCKNGTLVDRYSLPKCPNCKEVNETCRRNIESDFQIAVQHSENILNSALNTIDLQTKEMKNNCIKSFDIGSILYLACIKFIEKIKSLHEEAAKTLHYINIYRMHIIKTDKINRCDFNMKYCIQTVINKAKSCQCKIR